MAISLTKNAIEAAIANLRVDPGKRIELRDDREAGLLLRAGERGQLGLSLRDCRTVSAVGSSSEPGQAWGLPKLELLPGSRGRKSTKAAIPMNGNG